jgi:nucleotide-binding universal stress UspA family protein
MSYSCLLVPVDGSDPALRALAVAVELAGALGARIELV